MQYLYKDSSHSLFVQCGQAFSSAGIVSLSVHVSVPGDSIGHVLRCNYLYDVLDE